MMSLAIFQEIKITTFSSKASLLKQVLLPFYWIIPLIISILFFCHSWIWKWEKYFARIKENSLLLCFSLLFFFDFRSAGKRATFSKGIGTIMMKYWYPIHISFMRLAKHPSLLRTFGFSAISTTYHSYLPSIFWRNALIWCYFQNIWEGLFLRSKDATQSRNLEEAEKDGKKSYFCMILSEHQLKC